MMNGIVIWGACAIIGSALAGILAGIKNRDYSFWMAWCFLVPPLVLFLLFLPKREGPRPRQPSLDEQDRRDSTYF
jgi:hypothetical protein